MVTKEKEFDRAVQDHIAGCSRCSDLERARNLVGHDLVELGAEARQESMSFQELRQCSFAQYKQREKSGKPTNSNFRVSLSNTRRLTLSMAVLVIAVIVAVLLPFNHDSGDGYEIVVAGIDETLLLSGAIDQLFAAVGLPGVVIKEVECNPQCAFRVTGLRNLTDTRLAVAALQAVPDAVILSADTFKDQRTGREITRTTSTSKLTISDNRWALELGIDSSIYKRISLALDSLKQDTTLTWTQWFRFDEGDVPGVQEEYTVHPDGSYSKSIYAGPRAQTGWSKITWTFDTTNILIGHTVIDKHGVSHDIDVRNWTVKEQQLRKVGIYHMITYDEDGRPHHTTTNYDPAGVPGYEPILPPGMFLNQNEPNPFDTVTHITFGLPEEAPVRLKIYDRAGQLVRTLIDRTMAAGKHTITWKARSDQDKRVRQFRFLCKLQVGEYYHTIVMSQVW
jgi:hypothetical protein